MRVFLSVVAAVVVVGFFIGETGRLKLNRTDSMPRGLWLLSRLNRSPERGDVLAICLPPIEYLSRYFAQGDCPTGREPILKYVEAIAGDVVVVTDEGVTVNGIDLPNSKPMAFDSENRPVEHVSGEVVILPGMIWIESSVPNSFDSRYFGPVPTANIRGAATPLWIYE